MFEGVKIKYNKRNHFYDLLKFLAIIFVCLSHISFLSDGFYYWFRNIVFLLELPLFFFVSGILQYNLREYKTFRCYLIVVVRRFICYLLPYVTFHFFRCVLYNDYPNLFNRIYDNICYPFNGLWFLLGIFIISFILETSKYLLTRKEWQAKYYYPLILPIMCEGLWLSFSKIFNILPFAAYFRLCLYYSIYILFGYYLCLFKDVFKEKKMLIKNVCMIGFVASLITFNIIIFVFDNVGEFDDTNILLIMVRIAGSTTGIVIVAMICSLLIKYKPFQYISFGGMFTLQIYYLHILFGPFIPSMSELSVFAQLGMTVLWNSIFVVGSLMVVHILYFIPYIHFVIFGSHYSMYSFEKELLRSKTC